MLLPALVLLFAVFEEPSPQIDYAGFATLTIDVRARRADRLLGLTAFNAKAAEKGALILDARSAIAGARDISRAILR